MKKALCFLLGAALVLLGGCAAGDTAGTDEPGPAGLTEQDTPSGEPETGESLIDLGAKGAEVEGALWSDDSALLISAAGTYRLTGAMAGRVTVDADGPVELILDGVSLTGESCLDVRSGDPVTLWGAPGTVNVLSDTLPDPASGEASSPEPSGEASDADAGAEEVEETEEAEAETENDASGAVITSKAPLRMAGGSITVNAHVNNGIRAKDGFTLLAGTLTMDTAHHGVRVRGGLSVLGGSVNVTAGGDAFCAEAGRLTAGAVSIRGGTVVLTAGGRGIDAADLISVESGSLSVTAENDGMRAGVIDIAGGGVTLDARGDGLQAVSELTVSGGTLSITTGGGGGDAASHPGESFGPWSRSSSSEEEVSAKGLKSEGGITLSGGDITLDTADDSIHCGTVFTMDAGTLSIVSSDDAIHADDMLVIGGGTVDILDCFEGLEAFAVELRGGDVVIRAVNDGINANGAEMMFGGGSSDFESVSGAETTYFLMSGGTLDLAVTGSMSNMGDGVDSNGGVYITGGEMVVSTYGSFMENGLDTGWGGPVVTGGRVIAGGSSTMAEGFSSYSTQCCAVVPTSYMPDGTRVTITDEDGNELWSVVMADGFSCLQISHPDMVQGHVYTLTYGTQSTTLDFTDTTNISSSRGFGFPGRPF